MYARRVLSIFDFFFFSLNLASRVDMQRLKFAEVLAESGSREHVEALERVKANKDAVFDRLKGYGGLQSENMITNSVDNFLFYLSSILQSVLRKRPEMLSSNEMVRIDEIVKFSSMKDVINYLVDKKLNELSYAGLRGIEKFFMERTGIDLVENQTEKAELVHAIEIRNIYTHNRGIVNDVFVHRLSGVQQLIPFKKGERIHANYDNIVRLSSTMTTVSARFDQAVSRKFNIGRKKFSTWGSVFNEEEYRLRPVFDADFLPNMQIGSR